MAQRGSIKISERFGGMILHNVDEASNSLARGIWSRCGVGSSRATGGADMDNGRMGIYREDIVAWFESGRGVVDWKWVG